MRINISSLLGRKGASFKVNERVASEFLESNPEILHALSPIEVQLTVTNTGNGFLVQGELGLAVGLQCSRCLDEFELKLQARVEEEFRSTPLKPEEAEEDEFMVEEIPLVEGDELDLADLIRESVLMNIPMKSVCEPDCPGLCPVCGIRLADETCDCLSPEVDIRMAPLQELLKTAERRKENGSTKEKTFESKD
ncbi:MAG TPA: DUF177 domain-containing protein [Firmicutes bacterium]|nr:DUF177 domain-containing protein [Bacillota bacterium]